MKKKELKRLLKLYKQDNNSMADESIKYKELAERATADCVRLVTKLQEYRERTNRAENMVERLIEAGKRLGKLALILDSLPANRYVDNFDAIVAEWQANPPKNYRDRDNA